jgi:hypothetical protein
LDLPLLGSLFLKLSTTTPVITINNNRLCIVFPFFSSLDEGPTIS